MFPLIDHSILERARWMVAIGAAFYGGSTAHVLGGNFLTWFIIIGLIAGAGLKMIDSSYLLHAFEFMNSQLDFDNVFTKWKYSNALDMKDLSNFWTQHGEEIENWCKNHPFNQDRFFTLIAKAPITYRLKIRRSPLYTKLSKNLAQMDQRTLKWGGIVCAHLELASISTQMLCGCVQKAEQQAKECRLKESIWEAMFQVSVRTMYFLECLFYSDF